MIVIKIELHSARTGKVTELGRAMIHNTGGTVARGDYEAIVFQKNSETRILRSGKVFNYPRQSYNMWRLIIRSLLSCFPEEKK